MRWLLLLLAACNPSWDGTWSDGVHAPLIVRSCADDEYLVFSFSDRSYAAQLLWPTQATPFSDGTHVVWQGMLRLANDAITVDIDGNQFTATSVPAIDDDAVDCATLHQ